MHDITVLDGFNRLQSDGGQMQGTGEMMDGTNFQRADELDDFENTITLDEMNGTDNANMFNRVGVGANAGTRPSNLQGFNRIMQGYMQGTEEDLEEWAFLVDIEHPIVMQGFEAFLGDEELNGKRRKERRKKRAAKKAARQQKKQQRKTTRAAKKEERKAPARARKAKRAARKDERQAHKSRRKEARTAKKEERVARKMQRREQRQLDKEARRARKQQRLDDRKERQRLRQEGRTERQAMRAERGGLFAEGLQNIGGDVGGALLSNLVGGEGVFQDSTFSDFAGEFLPSEFEGLVDNLQDMPYEDALDMRDQIEDEMFMTRGGEDLDADEGGNKMLVPLLIAGGLLAVSMSQKKKKR